MITKFAGVPAFALTLPILIVGSAIIVAVPVVVPATALAIELMVIVKFLPPELSCVVTPGKLTLVLPARIVAVPVAVV